MVPVTAHRDTPGANNMTARAFYRRGYMTTTEAFATAVKTAKAVPVLLGLVEGLVVVLYGLHKRIAALEPEPAEWPAPPDFDALRR
jgi:hypothetical protein